MVADGDDRPVDGRVDVRPRHRADVERRERPALELVPGEPPMLGARDPVPEPGEQALVRLWADRLEHERPLARAVEAHGRDAVLGDRRLDAKVPDRREHERLGSGGRYGALVRIVRTGPVADSSPENAVTANVTEQRGRRRRCRGRASAPAPALDADVRAAWQRAATGASCSCPDRSKVASALPPAVPDSRRALCTIIRMAGPRPDDHDPALGPARRTAGALRPRLPPRGDARPRPLPLPDRVGDRVHAQPARARPDAAEAPARDLGRDRLPALRIASSRRC